MIINLPINHSDDRGSIRDIFVGTPKDHCSIITFTLGAVRANHFHKLTTQYTYVIEGEITMATSTVDEAGNATSEIEKRVLVAGDLVTHPPYHAHAFRAVTKATILAFADGVRGGADYEKDVYRLKTSMV